MKNRIVRIVLPALITVASEQSFFIEKSFAITYLTLEEAQATLAPNANLQKIDLAISEEKIEQIEDYSGISFNKEGLQIWRASSGNFFIVDNVRGKHEYITYAVVLNSLGALQGLEILEYREAYGDEVRREAWRDQFKQKKIDNNLELNENIINISGATISCSQITKGIRRLLSLHNLVLKNLS